MTKFIKVTTLGSEEVLISITQIVSIASAGAQTVITTTNGSYNVADSADAVMKKISGS